MHVLLEVAPGAVDTVPAAHDVIAVPPVQNEPAGHWVQADTEVALLAVDHVPAAHWVGEDAPVGQYDPEGQLMGSAPPVQYDPAGHCAHSPSSVAPGLVSNVPAGHAVGLLSPALAQYSSAGHVRQVDTVDAPVEAE
jgi:hypothetical protein